MKLPIPSSSLNTTCISGGDTHCQYAIMLPMFCASAGENGGAVLTPSNSVLSSMRRSIDVSAFAKIVRAIRGINSKQELGTADRMTISFGGRKFSSFFCRDGKLHPHGTLCKSTCAPPRIFIGDTIAVYLQVPQYFVPIKGRSCQILPPVGGVKEHVNNESGTSRRMSTRSGNRTSESGIEIA